MVQPEEESAKRTQICLPLVVVVVLCRHCSLETELIRVYRVAGVGRRIISIPVPGSCITARARPYLKISGISAPDLAGIFYHASSFIRIPGTNKIREYGSNLQLIKFERWLRWSAQIFFKYVRLCVPEATDVSQIM